MSDTTSASLRRHEFWTPRIALAVTGPEGPLAVGDDLDVFEASDTLAECRTVGAEHDDKMTYAFDIPILHLVGFLSLIEKTDMG